MGNLIHGSSEGRFKVTYCTRPENLSKEEIENVGYSWTDYEEAKAIYNPDYLEKGMNKVGNEDIFYIPAPAQGLWACRSKFENR